MERERPLETFWIQVMDDTTMLQVDSKVCV